jgi:hypothetical protein
MTKDTNTLNRPQQAPSTLAVWLLLAAIFAAVQFASLFSPPLLDDVDAAHAQVAQHMAETGDLITGKIDGIRYIEKPPLPYWIVAGAFKIFGQNTLPPPCPMRSPCSASPGSPGSGRAAPGERAPASMPV